MLYLFIFLMMLAGCYIYDYRQFSHGRLLSWLFLMVVLICVAGFRYKMGIDSIKYENYYHWQHTLPQLRAEDFKDTRFAPLYIIVSAICRTLTYDFMLMQFVVSTTINASVFYFIWKNTRHIFFAALMYFISLYITLNMEVLREAMAVSVFLWAWPSFKSGKWIRYYLLSVVAFLFHVSAIIMFVLPVFYLPWFRWFFSLGARTWIICIGILMFSFVLQLFFTDFIQLIAITENMIERAQVYSKTDLLGNTLNLGGISVQLIKTVIYPMLALYFVKAAVNDNHTHSKDFDKQEFMTLMAVYVSLLTIGIAIFLRYRNYFYIFSILTMSDFIFSIVKYRGKYYRVKLIYWILLFMPLVGVQLFYYRSDFNKSGSLKVYDMYYPYSNRFDEEIDPKRRKAIDYSRHL